MRFDDRGRIWVQRETAEGLTELDLIDGKGALVATVESPMSFEEYRPWTWWKGRPVVVTNGPDDIPQVVRFRVDTTARN